MRIVLAVAALIALSACDMSPDQRARMSALGQSMSYQGAAWTAASRPAPVVYSPSYVRYCGTDGFGRPYFCY